ncbi:MAG TPA: DUF2784 domain-containing protein [Nitrospira sp.]|nr:DUF2784 domain-containing protein [Nitrospira sp.]
MWYAGLADLIVVLHFGFVLFVVLGGLLALKRPTLAWWHLPAVVWGAFVEFTGWICPLTPLENRLRALAGQQGYNSDFIAQYLLPLLYPEHLTRDMQVLLGTLVVGVNVVIYGMLWRQWKRRGVDPAL